MLVKAELESPKSTRIRQEAVDPRREECVPLHTGGSSHQLGAAVDSRGGYTAACRPRALHAAQIASTARSIGTLLPDRKFPRNLRKPNEGMRWPGEQFARPCCGWGRRACIAAMVVRDVAPGGGRVPSCERASVLLCTPALPLLSENVLPFRQHQQPIAGNEDQKKGEVWANTPLR
jgi:hypothetical protein